MLMVAVGWHMYSPALRDNAVKSMSFAGVNMIGRPQDLLQARPVAMSDLYHPLAALAPRLP